MIATLRSLGIAASLALAAVGCSKESAPIAGERSTSPLTSSATALERTDSENVLNIYNWAGFIDPTVVAAFEKEYGIKVNYDVYDSNEQLETKLLIGHSNYDVVVPGGSFFERQLKKGLYLKLDTDLLPNLANLDPEAVRSFAVYDPGSQFGVAYMWLTTAGIGYDVAKVKARMANAPIESWRVFFDPTVLAKFKDCGVSVLDAPTDVLSSVLSFLGKNPNSENPEDLKAAEQVLRSVRPYIRSVDSTRYISDLANGDLCLVLGWSGDVTQARDRAKEAANGPVLAYSIPKEGTINIFDVLAIPADAPHPKNAHLFLNYMLRPEVAAKNSSAVSYATPVLAAVALLRPELRDNPAAYPPSDVRARLIPQRAKSAEFTRLLTRAWTRFKTGT